MFSPTTTTKTPSTATEAVTTRLPQFTSLESITQAMFDRVLPLTSLAPDPDAHRKALRCGAYFHTLYSTLSLQFHNSTTIPLEEVITSALSIMRSLGLVPSPATS